MQIGFYFYYREKSEGRQLLALRQHLREVLVNVFAEWEL